MTLSSEAATLKVCILGPAPLLLPLQEGIGLLGHQATATDPRDTPPAFLDTQADLLLVLLREDLEAAIERWEPLFPSGAEILFDEADHREAWPAQRWAHHFQTKLAQLALKKATMGASPPEPMVSSHAGVVSPALPEGLNGGFDFYDETGVDEMVLMGSPIPSPHLHPPIAIPPSPPALSLAPTAREEEIPSPAPRVALPVVAWRLEGEAAPELPAHKERPGVILVVAGMGGPAALLALVEQLPSNLAASVVIFQELPKGRYEVLASNLQKRTQLAVGVAQTNAPLTSGQVVLALPSQQLFDQPGWQLREGSSAQSACQLGENDALVLLSGTPGEWLIPAMEAVSRGVLLLGQQPAEAVEARVISSLSETGLVADTMEAIGQHLADRWALTMG